MDKRTRLQNGLVWVRVPPASWMFSAAGIFILFLTLLSILLQGINHWFLSSGKLEKAYPLTIVVYICCIILETFLALRDPSQWSVILFLPLYVWVIVMALRGRARLKREQKK